MLQNEINAIKEYSKKSYMCMTRQAEGQLKYPYIVPGSATYSTQLWDWDSWLTDVAVRQIMLDNDDHNPEYIECEKGCVLNFLDHALPDGRIPIVISQEENGLQLSEHTKNIHKPCLAQHMLFIAKNNGSDIKWTENNIDRLCAFVDYYVKECRHEKTGLYFWLDDGAIGVDDDPCTFYRPEKSSASIYLNSLMYKELQATARLLSMNGMDGEKYRAEAEHLKCAMQEHMWDERNCSYYSVDLNLMPIESAEVKWLHSGSPRHYHSLIQKIDTWSNFMAMWAGIATEEQAKHMVYENLLDEGLFWAPYGVRTLSKKEKMYRIAKTGNPSCWQGPIWGISNYICFRALQMYGFMKEATELAKKTVALFGRDIIENGDLHEYYHPETGEGVSNCGFQNWNLLVNNMIAWLEGRDMLHEV